MAAAQRHVSSTYLIVDARERAVIPFIETELQSHAFVVKQVTTADYLICRHRPEERESRVIAAIERKTHEDFAASFKDARCENINKLRALRAATGCQLYYFIEGPAFPSPNRRFARIPFSCILASITKLMVRDGVFIVQTENESHTAKRLADLLRVFDSVENPYGGSGAPVGGSGNPDGNGASGNPDGDGGSGDPDGDGASGDPDGNGASGDPDGNGASGDPDGPPLALTVPDILTARVEQLDDEAAIGMWVRLRGISVVLGKILTREFTVAELVTQRVTPDQIRALRTATGRPVNKDAVASLLAVRAGVRDAEVKLLSGLRNITPAVAGVILEVAGGLSRLCAQPVSSLATVQLPQKTRTVQLGKVRAGRIQRILNYKDVTLLERCAAAAGTTAASEAAAGALGDAADAASADAQVARFE